MKTTQNENVKTCGKCRETKNIEFFPRAKEGTKSYNTFKNGIKPWCKDCYREYNNMYMRKKREEDYRYDHFFRRYGLKREDYEKLHEELDYKCQICGEESDHRYDKLCVDHDHKTGKVRGLLCFSCNVMLGQVRDCPERLKKAIEYLEKNK